MASVADYTLFLSVPSINHLGGSYGDTTAAGQAKEAQFNATKKVSAELGTPLNLQKATVQSHAATRDRLLTVFEATMQEAGHGSLLNATNLGEAGAHLQGGVSSEKLRDVLNNTGKDTRWAFAQNSDGSISPIESTKKFHILSDGRQALTLSRTDIANKIANEVDSHVGTNLIEKVINNTRENIQAAIETAGWAAADGHFARNAKHYVAEAIEAGKLVSKYIPKQAWAFVAVAADLVNATAEASTSQGDALTRTGKFLNTATAGYGGVAARELANGNVDASLRDVAKIYVNGSESILRSPEAQAVIDALPKDGAMLTQMQTDMKLPPIDRHLAEYKLRFIEASAKGDLLKGLSASSALTDLAERKVLLQAQWKADADTFKAAAQNHDTNWAQFKKDNPDLVIQADMHLAAKNSGHAQAFVDQMDRIIADNTAKGTPMQPIAQQLSQLTQQHSANEPDIEQVATR
jgi:hypothetical protein